MINYYFQKGIQTGTENLEYDAFLPNVIPQLIPDGDYRTLVRMHTSKNETFLQILITINIHAIDKMKAYDMG